MNLTRVAVLTLTMAAATSVAQTRTGEIEAARDEKAHRLRPEITSSIENTLRRLKDERTLERLRYGLNGFTFRIGGGMSPGSGIAGGPAFFRDDLLGGRVRLSASAAISMSSWQKYDLEVAAPRLAGNKLALALRGGRRDYRSIDFYGNGPDSQRNGRSAYRHEDNFVEGLATAHPFRHLRVGTSVGGLWVNVAKSNTDAFAPTETLYDDTSAPGLAAQTNFIRSGIFGEFDYRDNPAGPKSGGHYLSEFAWYNDRSLGTFSFHRWDIDVEQYIPLFNKTRRFAVRARMSMADAASGDRVPFYLQPRLGGADDLRGFRPYRFTDRNSVVYNAEYRWEIFSGLDGALFFDAGKVMPQRGHLSFKELEVSPGFGLRFNARNKTFLRTDVGFSHEGFGVWLRFNDPFLPRLFGIGGKQPVY